MYLSILSMDDHILYPQIAESANFHSICELQTDHENFCLIIFLKAAYSIGFNSSPFKTKNICSYAVLLIHYECQL